VRRSRTFYEQALEPFVVKVVESPQGLGLHSRAVEISGSGKGTPRPLPFMWPSPQQTEPPLTSSGYYAAFVIDPDGNNVEAVFHGDRQLPAA
jgi:hypothetical protein